MSENIYHFPAEITLLKYPLVEAWLEIQWESLKKEDQRGDSDYLIGLASFLGSVSADFHSVEALPAANLPLDVGRIVRHRFRPEQNQWPLIQFGSGVASLNYRPDNYTWKNFQAHAVYLHEKLLGAFSNSPIRLTSVALRYRNAEFFSYTEGDVLDFVRKNLNVMVSLPPQFPGENIVQPLPRDFKLQLNYNVQIPPAVGVFNISTGRGTFDRAADDGTVISTEEEIVVWQTELLADSNHAIDFNDVQAYQQWLEMAHATAHEWFFSLIEGPLREKYERA